MNEDKIPILSFFKKYKEIPALLALALSCVVGIFVLFIDDANGEMEIFTVRSFLIVEGAFVLVGIGSCLTCLHRLRIIARKEGLPWDV